MVSSDQPSIYMSSIFFTSKQASKQASFKMAVAFPPPLVPIAGASDREGRSRRNRHHWIAPSRGIIPTFLILIIAAHRGFNIVPFQEVYCTAMQHGSKADDGSDRGPARGPAWCYERVSCVEVSMPSLCPCPVSMPFSMSCCHSVLRARIPLVCMP